MHFHFQHEEITKFIKKHKIHGDILARLNILNVVLNMQFKVKIKNFALSKYNMYFLFYHLLRSLRTTLVYVKRLPYEIYDFNKDLYHVFPPFKCQKKQIFEK